MRWPAHAGGRINSIAGSVGRGVEPPAVKTRSALGLAHHVDDQTGDIVLRVVGQSLVDQDARGLLRVVVRLEHAGQFLVQNDPGQAVGRKQEPVARQDVEYANFFATPRASLLPR